MTITSPERYDLVHRLINPFDPPLSHEQRRGSLINAARIRYRHPAWAAVRVALDAPAVPADERGAWLDDFGDLVDRWVLLRNVGSTDDARRALEALCEGPWTGEVLAEALTRRDELSAAIDQAVREAQ